VAPGVAAELVNRTRVFCAACRASHDAAIERLGNRIVGRVYCPAGERTVPLSSDAALFLKFRRRGRRPPLSAFPRSDGILISLLDVTNGCNFRCPICYADAAPADGARFLPVEEAVARARAARRKGIWEVSLIGGEPTVHPELPAMIRGIRALGLRVTVSSNGYLFGRDPGLAARLKAAGLAKVNVQFDTFDRETHRRLRGNDAVGEKIAACDNLLRAGVTVGTITTVTTLNLKELKRIVEFGLARAPRLSTITFDAATPEGRYELPADTIVDRESIIRELVASEAVSGLTEDHFWPTPHFPPWRMAVHPDCGAACFLRAEAGRTELVDGFVNLAALFDRMARAPAISSRVLRTLALIWLIVGATRRGRRRDVFRAVAGTARGDARCGLVAVYAGSFVGGRFWDEERIAGCPASYLEADGFVPPCLRYLPARDAVMAEAENTTRRRQS